MTKKHAELLTRSEVDKKNFSLSVINGIAFRAGFEYVNAFTIVSVFIHTLTGSVMLAGLSQFVQTFFMQLGRFVTAPKIHTIKNQPIYMAKINFYSRFLWLVLSVMLFMNVSNNILIPALFVTIAVSWFLGGKVWPVFEDHFARTILPRRRSELLGYRELLGGLAAFVGAFVVKQVLGSGLEFNNKYGILFSLGFIFLFVSGLPLYKMKDPYHKVDENPMSLLKVLRNTRKILREDSNYKWYLTMRCIWIITDSALLWTLIAVKTAGNLSDVTISYMLISQIVGRLGGGLLWGKVAKRSGSRTTIIIAHVINILIAISMIIIIGQNNVSNMIYMMINFIVGLSTPSVMAAFVYFSETTQIRKRPRFMTIESAISMPLAFANAIKVSLNIHRQSFWR